MSDSDKEKSEQEKMAEEWAAALSGEDSGTDGDTGGSDSLSDDDHLADEWAAALAEDEQKQVKKEKEQGYFAQIAKEADFKYLKKLETILSL